MKNKRLVKIGLTRLIPIAIAALSLSACGPDGTHDDGGHGDGGGHHLTTPQANKIVSPFGVK